MIYYMESLPQLPNEILSLIFKYHRQNIRQIVKIKKQKLHEELLRNVELYNDDDYVLPGGCYLWLGLYPNRKWEQTVWSVIKKGGRYYIMSELLSKHQNREISIDITCAETHHDYTSPSNTTTSG